ncbi:hypothetical protein PIB30_031687 [Stylosanthes scabra]|uniref:Uncharacterized protein n=1 Tax=Stylosanthes scabra TaxID=79078 RepID=A0ABU6QBP0_9FABA|nr:hypothetical protein [Stylosanthes scabra]
MEQLLLGEWGGKPTRIHWYPTRPYPIRIITRPNVRRVLTGVDSLARRDELTGVRTPSLEDAGDGNLARPAPSEAGIWDNRVGMGRLPVGVVVGDGVVFSVKFHYQAPSRKPLFSIFTIDQSFIHKLKRTGMSAHYLG